MNPLFICAVVKDHVKTSRHGDDEFVQLLVSMSSSLRTAGYVVEVINALNFKWDVAIAFNERKITAHILYFRKIDDPAEFYAHLRSLRLSRRVAASSPLPAAHIEEPRIGSSALA